MAANPRKGSTTRQEDRIHFWQASTAQKYLSGQTLLQISERYLRILTRNLDTLDIQNEWVGLPDLYNFLQMEVSRAAIESMMGSKILELNPTLVEDFWNFDSNVPNYIRGFPRWIIPSAYKARDRLLASVKKWHAYAHEHSDCSKLGPDDPEWDPYFGTKLVKARQNYALKMKPMDADARASEDMGLLFAANANAVPSIFWYLFETLKDSSLGARMWAEARTCRTEDSGFDITRLSNKPLLQSAYAEVLRLRVAITMTRTDEFGDFNLAGYTVPKHKPIVIFSRTAALNEEAWTLAGRPPSRPLEEFYADRFLAYPDATNDKGRASSNPAELSSETETTENLEPAEPQFSLDGLAGCWLPYGGGQRMCPGRHFAKNEIIGTFALLFSRYEIQLKNADHSKVQPDMRWYPVGGLPPVCKVPFRIRKRQGS
ncbi:cytochrome P450 [Glonium stellatum]|uniref:Cytochrome P450 n=1 Tax=Glonium stellatum TaxID=574774 RepID=A0A8E2F4B9_9PEZI|nr:cytochrome P450 [Glonium stellatum]